MNFNSKFHTYYTCHICKCIKHTSNILFTINSTCHILNMSIHFVYRATIPNWSNYRRNIIICNWWMYYNDYVWQRHCWVQQYRFCVVTSENCVSTWTTNDLTIDINEHTNWGWSYFSCIIFFFCSETVYVTMQSIGWYDALKYIINHKLMVGVLWNLEA